MDAKDTLRRRWKKSFTIKLNSCEPNKASLFTLLSDRTRDKIYHQSVKINEMRRSNCRCTRMFPFYRYT